MRGRPYFLEHTGQQHAKNCLAHPLLRVGAQVLAWAG